MLNDRVFIFHMCIPYGETVSLMSRSSVNIKVKYQGHTFLKMAVTRAGSSVSQTHFVLFFIVWVIAIRGKSIQK